MSTSLLYHGLGVQGYRHVRTRFDGGAVVFVIEQPRENCRCARCGSAEVHSRGSHVRHLLPQRKTRVLMFSVVYGEDRDHMIVYVKVALLKVAGCVSGGVAI